MNRAVKAELPAVIERLEKFHGKPKPPDLDGPLEMILWENVVYLADDQKRRAAFEALRNEVGFTPKKILAASLSSLLAIARKAGILPEQQAEKLRRIAQIVQNEFDGDLNQALKLPLDKAKRALGKFPAIGGSSAEKILLFCHAIPCSLSNQTGCPFS